MNKQPSDESEVNRFVDGEMNRDAERDFLARCEAEPDRYRTLALAFVEDRQLSRWMRSSDSAVTIAVPASQHSPLAMVRSLAALAALAAVLMLGWGAGRWSSQPDSDKPNVVESGVESMVVSSDASDQRAHETFPVPENPAQENPAQENPAQENLATAPDDRATLVSMVKDMQPSPAFSRDELAEFEADGLKVRQTNRVFLFELLDGRQLAIPAELTFLAQEP